MAAEYGFVYILGNVSMPGIFKIGFTLGHPKARMEQLSGATACPTPFYLAACFGAFCPRDVEAEIHQEFASCRVNASREFFQIEPVILQDIVARWGDAYDDLVNTVRLDAVAEAQENFDVLQWKINHFSEQCADPIHWPQKMVGGLS